MRVQQKKKVDQVTLDLMKELEDAAELLSGNNASPDPEDTEESSTRKGNLKKKPDEDDKEAILRESVEEDKVANQKALEAKKNAALEKNDAANKPRKADLSPRSINKDPAPFKSMDQIASIQSKSAPHKRVDQHKYPSKMKERGPDGKYIPIDAEPQDANEDVSSILGTVNSRDQDKNKGKDEDNSYDPPPLQDLSSLSQVEPMQVQEPNPPNPQARQESPPRFIPYLNNRDADFRDIEDEKLAEVKMVTVVKGGIELIAFEHRAARQILMPAFFNELPENEKREYSKFKDSDSNFGQACLYLASVMRLFGNVKKATTLEDLAMSKTEGPLKFRGILTQVNADTFSSVMQVLHMDKCEISHEPILDPKTISEYTSGKCKDFSDYMSVAVNQFYYPEKANNIKHFVAQHLSNRKVVYTVAQIRQIKVKNDPEFDFVTCFRRWAMFPMIAISIPDVEPDTEETSCDRTFFFNIVNTAYPNVIHKLIAEVRRVKQRAPNRPENAKSGRFVNSDVSNFFKNEVNVSANNFAKSGGVRYLPFVAHASSGTEDFEINYTGSSKRQNRRPEEALISEVYKAKKSREHESEEEEGEDSQK